MNQTYIPLLTEVVKRDTINGVKLEWASKVLYCYLRAWQLNNEKVFPNYKRMQEDLNIKSRTSLLKYLDYLEEANLVYVIRKRGKGNKYTIFELDGNLVKQVKFKQPSYQVYEDKAPF